MAAAIAVLMVSAASGARDSVRSAANRPIRVRATTLSDLVSFEGGGYFAWVENSRRHANHYDLFLQHSGRKAKRINPAGTGAEAGGIDAGRLVYAQERGGSAQLELVNLSNLSTTPLTPLGSGELGEHPTLSGRWILFTRGLRTGTTRVLLYNLTTGELRQLATITAGGTRSFVYSGQVSGNYAVWGKVVPGGQDVYLYNIVNGSTTLIARTAGVFARYDPAVTPTGTVYFEQSDHSCRPRVKLVAEDLNAGPRVLATLARGVDAGYIYADSHGASTSVLFSEFHYRGCETSAVPGRFTIYKLLDSG